jgi:photosystem II stability/assembly factor-like uncharacterized protein
MMKTFGKAGILILIICIMGFCAGCKGRRKMEMPDIKSITMENVHGVIALDDDNIWLTGGYGVIFHSSDGGQNWTRQNSGEKETVLCDGVFLDKQNGWVVGVSGTILHTSDGGATWNRQTTGTDRHLFGITFADKDYGWAVGEWGTIIHTADGGATWKKQHKEFDRILNNVYFADRKEGWLVGERGTILHTTDGGETWNPQLPKSFERASFEDELFNPPPSLFGMYFTDRDNGWACGIDGTIIRTSDGGTTWNDLSSGTEQTLYTIYIKNGKSWVVGDKGTYLMSDDNGTTWKLYEELITTKKPFRDICFSSLEKGWIVGAGGTVVHTSDGGKTWEFRSGLSYAMEFFEMPKALEFGGGTE